MSKTIKRTGLVFECIRDFKTGSFSFLKGERYYEAVPSEFDELFLRLIHSDDNGILLLENNSRSLLVDRDDFKRVKVNGSNHVNNVIKISVTKEEFEDLQPRDGEIRIIIKDNGDSVGTSIEGEMDRRILRYALQAVINTYL